ncbi:MAG: alpha/beta hydrolase [Chloroflexi bacterium]|nr:alpha/beta hydrolase [Chloroflexota bacterium]
MAVQHRNDRAESSEHAAPVSIGKYLVNAAVGAIGISGLAAGLIAGVGGVVAYAAAKPRPVWGTDDPPEGTFEEIEFPSAEDETRICGWFFRASTDQPAPAIIICHGAWTGRRECTPLALRFRDAGYHVLTFDFRAHGMSEGRYITVGHHEMKDVLGAVDYLLQRNEVDASRIATIGFSMGAASSLLAAARSPHIAAVVADSAYADFCDAVSYSFHQVGRLPAYPFAPVALLWGQFLVKVDARALRPVDSVGQITRPVLFIHGADDEIVPTRQAQMLFDAAGGPKELWLVPGARHVGARDQGLDAYYERIARFLEDALRLRPIPLRGRRASGRAAHRRAA